MPEEGGGSNCTHHQLLPCRVCCLPPRSAVGWSTRGARGYTQIWHVPLPHCKKATKPQWSQPDHRSRQLRRTNHWNDETVPAPLANSLAGKDWRSVTGRHSSTSCTLPELLSNNIPLGVWFTNMKLHTSILTLCHYILSFTP